MKKIKKILIALVLVTLVMPLALADEAEDALEDEVKIIENPYGSEIRFLQLEKSISKNIFKGEYIISVLNESSSEQSNSTGNNYNETGYNETISDETDYNLSKLKAIIAEMKLLKQEVESANKSSSNVTEVFIDLKSDAVELTKEFREALRELVGEAKINALKNQVGEMVSEQNKNLTSQIQNKIKQYNRLQLNKIYEFLDEKNTSMLAKYENGTESLNDVKQQIAEKLNQMTKEKKGEVFSNIKEQQIRTRIQAKINIENAQENFQERKEQRLTNRLQNAKENENGNQLVYEIEKQIEQRLQNMGEDGGKGDK